MKKLDRKHIQHLIESHPDVVIEELLKGYYWPQELEANLNYMRISDDNSGYLQVAFSQDGDGWVNIRSVPDPEEPYGSQRYRTGLGGGESRYTRNALLILARAMQMDRMCKPQDHRRQPLMDNLSKSPI